MKIDLILLAVRVILNLDRFEAEGAEKGIHAVNLFSITRDFKWSPGGRGSKFRPPPQFFALKRQKI